MKLDELMDRPLPYEINHSSAKAFNVSFNAGDRNIQFAAGLNGEVWEIIFAEIKDGKATTKVTNSGNEFAVFTTIKAIIDEFIEKYNPKKITIDSSKGEPNRAKLYQRMLTRSLPSGWKFNRDDNHPSYTVFSLVKEGAVKRSDPYISGEKSGPRPPDSKLASRPSTAHRSKLETLVKKSGKSMEKVEAAWNRAAKEVADGPMKWAKVMIRVKADLGISI